MCAAIESIALVEEDSTEIRIELNESEIETLCIQFSPNEVRQAASVSLSSESV